MTPNQDELDDHYKSDFVIISVALDILKAGSKKSAIKKWAKHFESRQQAKKIVNAAGEYLLASYGPKWNKQSRDKLAKYADDLLLVRETMEETGMNGEKVTHMLFGSSDAGDKERDNALAEADPAIIDSPQSQQYSYNGHNYDIHIYRLEYESAWCLEVIDEEKASHCWDEAFEDDVLALQTAIKEIPIIDKE